MTTSNNNKIFLAVEIFPPEVGGPATYAVNLANELHSQGWDVKILCYGKPDKSILNSGIKINYVSNSWPVFIKFFLYFKKLFWFSIGYKTIYAMGPIASGLPALMGKLLAGWPARCVKKITGKKLIVKVVGDYAWEQAMVTGKTELLIDDFQKEKFSGKIGLLKKIESKVCQSADTVITPSEYLKKIVNGWGVKEDPVKHRHGASKIKVIYNSFFVCHSEPCLPAGRLDSESIQKKKGLIVSVGRLVKWKGLEQLIKACKELSLDLEIYGEGPEKDKLEKNLNKKIEKLNHTDLLQKLSQAEMFALNTGYEGLSHAVLEAMSVGTPVITTNVGGNPELITNNENGILVEYNNKEELKEAILKLHNNPELREKFVNNSKQILQKFTFEKMIKDTIEILEK